MTIEFSECTFRKIARYPVDIISTGDDPGNEYYCLMELGIAQNGDLSSLDYQWSFLVIDNYGYTLGIMKYFDHASGKSRI